MSEKKLLTVTEVAEFLGIPKRTLYRMIKDGRFAVLPVKGTDPRRWNVEEINAWRFGNEQH